MPIPHAITVAGPNLESVRTDWNVGVHRGERIVGLQPNGVYAVHPVLEANLFWPSQRNGIKTKLDVMRAGRQHQLTAGGVPFSSNGELFYENRGLALSKRKCDRSSIARPCTVQTQSLRSACRAMLGVPMLHWVEAMLSVLPNHV
jgi:hypothetical protein